jgi:murein DD-endopeptidase MepM/ murein hydrolase activator NlpD
MVIAARDGLPERDPVHVVPAHARNGSIRVEPGQRVETGQVLAEVGHSGNSTAPHLHFQLMDGADPLEAQGLPCCFRNYEAFRDGLWATVTNGVPEKRELIRYGGAWQA